MHHIPIIREKQTTDQTSPWEGISFTYDVGSDELAEALKIAFPKYRTLRERKHAAIVSFLKDELCRMQPSSNSTPASARTPPNLDVPHISPRASKAHTDTHFGAHLCEPVSASYSPASSTYSRAHGEPKQRYAAMQIPSPTSMSADPMTAVCGGQFVFNAFDGRTMQQKTKRKMTTDERLEYKETRRRGACSKCKRQKGKVGRLGSCLIKLSSNNT
jgi:hypothetical protein